MASKMSIKGLKGIYSPERRSMIQRSKRLAQRGATPLWGLSNPPKISELSEDELRETESELNYDLENFEKLKIELPSGDITTVGKLRSMDARQRYEQQQADLTGIAVNDSGLQEYYTVETALHQEPTFVAHGSHVHERTQAVIDFSKESIDPIIGMFNSLTKLYVNIYSNEREAKMHMGLDMEPQGSEISKLIDRVIYGYDYVDIGSSANRLMDIFARFSPHPEVKEGIGEAMKTYSKQIEGATENAQANRE